MKGRTDGTEICVRIDGPRGHREESVKRLQQGPESKWIVGDRTYDVEVVRVGPLFSVLMAGRQYELAVSRTAAGGRWIEGPHFAGQVEVLDRLARLAEVAAGQSGNRAKQQVRAYMPGRVVTLLAKDGDRVDCGDGVVVLEAMKMENEIAAESSGVVANLKVVPGQAVDSGDLLFEVLPAD